jgi:hypothetical protein
MLSSLPHPVLPNVTKHLGLGYFSGTGNNAADIYKICGLRFTKYLEVDQIKQEG